MLLCLFILNKMYFLGSCSIIELIQEKDDRDTRLFKVGSGEKTELLMTFLIDQVLSFNKLCFYVTLLCY